MNAYKITNTTINKIVLRDESDSAESIFGQYVSCLMLAGILPMRDSAYEYIGGDCWKTSNGWEFKVEAV